MQLFKNVSNGTVVFAKNLTEYNVDELFETKSIILEDLQSLKSEDALFHLFNMCKENNNKIMITSSLSPINIKFRLLDLKSRILSLPSVELKFPDDLLLEQIFIKLFLDKGLK